jgi:transcriptional regulator with XRE-family HTH domain
MQNRKQKPFESFESFEEFFDRAEERSDYWAERAKLEFTREVLSKMDKEGISKSELANRLEVWPGMVTRILSGRNNFELETMVRIAVALRCRFHSHLEPVGTKTIWFDVLDHAAPQEPKQERWNPSSFRSIEVFLPKSLNYAPVPAAA